MILYTDVGAEHRHGNPVDLVLNGQGPARLREQCICDLLGSA